MADKSKLNDVILRAELAAGYLSEFARMCEEFMALADMPASHFGFHAAGDPGFVYRLRKGKRLRAETVLGVLQWMGSYDAPSVAK